MDEEFDQSPLLNFIDQLRLLFVSPKGLHYSASVIILSFLWNMTAPNLYNKLSDFFILPTARRLRQLSEHKKVKASYPDLHYW